jgi:hypothetical protein
MSKIDDVKRMVWREDGADDILTEYVKLHEAAEYFLDVVIGSRELGGEQAEAESALRAALRWDE